MIYWHNFEHVFDMYLINCVEHTTTQVSVNALHILWLSCLYIETYPALLSTLVWFHELVRNSDVFFPPGHVLDKVLNLSISGLMWLVNRSTLTLRDRSIEINFFTCL